MAQEPSEASQSIQLDMKYLVEAQKQMLHAAQDEVVMLQALLAQEQAQSAKQVEIIEAQGARITEMEAEDKPERKKKDA